MVDRVDIDGGEKKVMINSIYILLLFAILFINDISAKVVKDSIVIESDSPFKVINFNDSIGMLHNNSFHDSVLISEKERLFFAKNSSDTIIIIEAFHDIGTAYFNLYKYDSALFYYKKSITYSKKINHLLLLGKSYVYCHLTYARSDEFEKAIFVLDSAMDYFPETESVYIATSNCLQAKMYDLRSEYPHALARYCAALQGFAELNDTVNISRTYLNIGVFYLGIQNYTEADIYLQIALNNFRELNDKKGLAKTYFYMGQLENDQNNIHDALIYFSNVIRIAEKEGDIEILAPAYEKLGYIYQYHHMDSDKAIQYYKKAYDDYKLMKSSIGIANVVLNVSEIYIQKGDFKQSEILLKQVFSYAESIGSLVLARDVLRVFSVLYEKKGNFKQSISCYRRYKLFSDSLLNQIQHFELEKIRADYLLKTEINEAEVRNEINKKLKIRQYIIIIVLSSVIVLFAAIFIALYYRVKRKNKISLKAKHIREQDLFLRQLELDNKEIRSRGLKKEIDVLEGKLNFCKITKTEKNDILMNMKSIINTTLSQVDDDSVESLQLIRNKIAIYLNSDRDWEIFTKYFEQVSSTYFVKFSKAYPALSRSDMKLCTLLYIGLSVKDLSSVLNIEPSSVKIARHRLRVKLNMNSTDNFSDFISKILSED